MKNKYKNCKLKIKKMLNVFRNFNYRLIRFKQRSLKKFLLNKKNLIN